MRKSVRMCKFEGRRIIELGGRLCVFDDKADWGSYTTGDLLFWRVFYMVTGIGNLVYIVLWITVYLSLPLVNSNETFIFEGLQHIHSHFFHQEAQ